MSTLPSNRFNLLRVERLQRIIKKLATTEPSPIKCRHIQALKLTTRSENCLKAEDIDTIDDLLKRSRADLLKTPNLGRRSANEIEEALDKIGLQLRGSTK